MANKYLCRAMALSKVASSYRVVELSAAAQTFDHIVNHDVGSSKFPDLEPMLMVSFSQANNHNLAIFNKQ
jgi:hypothetical protein